MQYTVARSSAPACYPSRVKLAAGDSWDKLECDFMSSLPDPDDVPDNLGIVCADTALESGEELEVREVDFFDELRDWVWKD